MEPKYPPSAGQSTDEPLRLQFLGALVEELGAQMYPSVTASVAELVSNAWDADADHVWVEMPLGGGNPAVDLTEITVTDDGDGMSRDDARTKYLVVGRKRRAAEQKFTSARGRPLHGRKGVGKLAAFGTARILSCTSVSRLGEAISFTLDYDAIRGLAAGTDYLVQETNDNTPLLDPSSGAPLAHGTRIRLAKLKTKRLPDEEQFLLSLARRFGALHPAMELSVNGKRLTRFDVPVEFRFPRDACPTPGDGLPADSSSNSIKIEHDLGIELLRDGAEIRWWIGFTPKPIESEELRGVAILAHEKMVQRPFMFGRGQGTVGQLGQEYLVGEVFADWIDDSIQSEQDLVLTNRSQLQTEDDRLQPLIEWGRKRLAWALQKRNDLRIEKNMQAVDVSPQLQDRLSDFTKREQAVFKTVADKLAKLPETDAFSVTSLTLEVIDAYDDRVVREMIDQISAYDETTQVQMWQLVSEFGLIDARKTKTKLEARLGVIAKLEDMVEHGAREVPDIHQHIRANPWLLDLRWELYDDEVDLKRGLEREYGINVDSGTGQYADYVFALRPSVAGPADEVIVVEIKRGTNADGTPRSASLDEVNKFHQYVLFADAHYGQNNIGPLRPRVRGLMIAAGYTATAQMTRRSFEEIPGQKFLFKDWKAVIHETKLWHAGGFELSKRRAGF